ncbi:MAG: hypothetical protein M1839_006390 [Geoglossum umbratile]|nr:MAG: hypothetical protein M1839_006390 [Geoglossum umbratile]
MLSPAIGSRGRHHRSERTGFGTEDEGISGPGSSTGGRARSGSRISKYSKTGVMSMLTGDRGFMGLRTGRRRAKCSTPPKKLAAGGDSGDREGEDGTLGDDSEDEDGGVKDKGNAGKGWWKQ